MCAQRKRVGAVSGSLNYSEPEFLLAGKLLKPHGLKGELWLKIITDFPEIFFKELFVYIGPDYIKIFIRKIRYAGEKLIISFEGFENVEGVRGFVNWDVFFSREQMPPLPDGEFYIHQIIGLSVYDTDGTKLGCISDVIQSGANDIYVIQTGKFSHKEVLIPAIESVIEEINLASSTMKINSAEWFN